MTPRPPPSADSSLIPANATSPGAAVSSSAAVPGLVGHDRSAVIDPGRIARLVFVLFLLAPLPWVVIYFAPPVNHDAAALLHFASRWLGGETLYVDLIDINPPLIFILNLVPAALDRWTPVNGPAALTICTLAWILAGFALCWRLLAGDTTRGGDLRRYVVPPLLLFLMIVYPGTEFAQREHLMLVAALPYLLLAEARIQRRTMARGSTLLIALFAALAFALKPHFLLIPLLVEVCVLTAVGRRAWLRSAVPVPMAILFVVYGLYVVFGTPEYLGSVVPLAMSQYLTLGGLGPLGVLLRSQMTASAVLLIPLAVCALPVSRPLARLAAVAAVAAIVIAMVQSKGWPYHVLPAETFVMLLAGVLLCDAASAQLPSVGPLRRNASVALLMALMLGAYYVSGLTRVTFWRQAGFENSQAGQLLKRYGHEMARGPTLILSPGLYPHFPVVNYADTTMAMRFMSLWPIQGAYERCLPDGRMYRRPDEMKSAEAFAYNAIVADFEKFRPRVIIVDDIPGINKCGARDFDFLEYFRQSPRFDSGWRQYHLLSRYDRYRIYLRNN